MTREERAWHIVTVLVALITMWVPLVVSVDQFERGGEPEKHVELDFIGPLNPMSDLSRFPGNSADLKIGGRSVHNLRAWSMIFENTGRSPITPDDFVRNLRVRVEPPWELVGVGNSVDDKRELRLDWTRIDEWTYEAKPFLFNPGDRLHEPIYATSSEDVEEYADVPEPKVTARIVNLTQFTRQEEPSSRRYSLVYLTFWDTVVLLILASVLLGWYLRQAARASLPTRGAHGILLIVGLALLSYSTAEVIVYFTFGGDPFTEMLRRHGRVDWRAEVHNWVVLAIHLVVSVALTIRGRVRATETTI